MRASSLRSGWWCCRRLALATALLALTAGCGKTGNVSGQISYKGQPLTTGHVTFYGADGRAATGQIKDGSYQVEAAPVGVARVTVNSQPPPPPVHTPSPFAAPTMKPPEGGEGKEAPLTGRPVRPPEPPPQRPAIPYVKIPQHYGKPDQSGLAYTVNSGDQTHDIHLE